MSKMLLLSVVTPLYLISYTRLAMKYFLYYSKRLQTQVYLLMYFEVMNKSREQLVALAK